MLVPKASSLPAFPVRSPLLTSEVSGQAPSLAPAPRSQVVAPHPARRPHLPIARHQPPPEPGVSLPLSSGPPVSVPLSPNRPGHPGGVSSSRSLHAHSSPVTGAFRRSPMSQALSHPSSGVTSALVLDTPTLCLQRLAPCHPPGPCSNVSRSQSARPATLCEQTLPAALSLTSHPRSCFLSSTYQ